MFHSHSKAVVNVIWCLIIISDLVTIICIYIVAGSIPESPFPYQSKKQLSLLHHLANSEQGRSALETTTHKFHFDDRKLKDFDTRHNYVYALKHARQQMEDNVRRFPHFMNSLVCNCDRLELVAHQVLSADPCLLVRLWLECWYWSH